MNPLRQAGRAEGPGGGGVAFAARPALAAPH